MVKLYVLLRSILLAFFLLVTVLLTVLLLFVTWLMFKAYFNLVFSPVVDGKLFVLIWFFFDGVDLVERVVI
jgi:hypothetical protein